VSELMKQAKNYGVQQLYTNAKGKNSIRRYAYCSDFRHGRTSDFLGVSAEGWKFRCKWDGHVFHVLPDPTAPTSAEGVEAWEKAQMQKRVDQLSQRGQA
jgi:hypothetical protein